MITVIIPTLLKAPEEVFLYTLTNLIASDVVSEIIIIDNTLGEFNKKFGEMNKVKVYDDINRYVNPAWNFGISQTKTPYYLLLNDDVLCHKNILDPIPTLFEDTNIGCILCDTLGVHLPYNTFDCEEYNKIAEQLVYAPVTYKDVIITSTAPYYGWFIAGRVSEYIFIPSNMLVFGGDDWIRYHTLKNNKKHITYNRIISHLNSCTCKVTRVPQSQPIEASILDQEIRKQGELTI
jgi:hypothetical protein